MLKRGGNHIWIVQNYILYIFSTRTLVRKNYMPPYEVNLKNKEDVTMFKLAYTDEELNRQIDFNHNKCEKCLHKCGEFKCRTMNHTAVMAERTVDIKPETKRRYFELIGS